MEDTADRIRGSIRKYDMIREGDTVILGLSGGPDSLCLFDILDRMRSGTGFSLEVIHVNHRFRPVEAELDQEFVEKLCGRKGIKCHTFVRDCRAIAASTGRTEEETGRLVRYESFCRTAMEKEAEGIPKEKIKIAVAQNRNDQAETVLFRMMRGTGVDGLAGMAPVSEGMGGYIFIRPLLETDRSDIERYCAENGLEPRLDRTNAETDYTRNRIRLGLIPYIDREFGTDITSSLERLSVNAREDSSYMNERAEELYGSAIAERSSGSVRLDRKMIAAAHPSVARRVILMAFRATGLVQDITRAHLLAAEELIRSERASGSLDLPGGYRFRVSYDEVIAERGSSGAADEEEEAPGLSKRIIPSDKFDPPREGRRAAYFDAAKLEEGLGAGAGYFDRLEVRTREEGDFIQLNGGRKSIQDLFVDMKVEKEKRDGVRMVVCGHEVLWIPEGECRARYAEKYGTDPGTARVLLLEI